MVRYGLSVKILQENLPNHYEVLLFQGVGAERHGTIWKPVVGLTLSGVDYWRRMRRE